MSYLRAFLPWIVYAAVSSISWPWAAVAALAVAVGVIVRQTQAGNGIDSLIIEIGSAAFFLVLAVIAFADPHSAIRPYSPALANGTLALISAISLATRRPFTLGIAKQSTPREYWTMPAFIRVNVIITSVWTAAFVITGVTITTIVATGHEHSAAIPVAMVAGIVLPMLFTIRYAAHVRAKAAQAR